MYFLKACNFEQVPVIDSKTNLTVKVTAEMLLICLFHTAHFFIYVLLVKFIKSMKLAPSPFF